MKTLLKAISIIGAVLLVLLGVMFQEPYATAKANGVTYLWIVSWIPAWVQSLLSRPWVSFLLTALLAFYAGRRSVGLITHQASASSASERSVIGVGNDMIDLAESMDVVGFSSFRDRGAELTARLNMVAQDAARLGIKFPTPNQVQKNHFDLRAYLASIGTYLQNSRLELARTNASNLVDRMITPT